MKFCPDCGTGHECSAEIAADRTELAIAKVQADRDIRLAEIGARAGIKIAETDAEHSSEHAEGVAEGMGDALDAITGGGDDGEGEPIVVDTSEPAEEPEAEAVEADNAPPEVVEVAEPATPKSRGYWAGYR